ncbi:MAG TPA: PQQ-dependent sugar dehydrogenase [Blastocatellia bacterium]
MRKISSLLLMSLAFLAFTFAVKGQAGGDSHAAAQSSEHPDVNMSLATTAPALKSILTGLSNPLYATSAHDGTNRLFVVEQTGAIKVLQPGAATPTVFLDLSSVVQFGGEQGLLGLAFHPEFWLNGRFFVHYTRALDGNNVISEFHVPAGTPNVADPTERVLVVMPQPFTNHNGGMIEFGRDGFLYCGKGDGGSEDDPLKLGQNNTVFNGKILRINIDQANGVFPYSIPSTNPFFNHGALRQEIYATGMRNPFRFSFDRGTGELYCGDVGQNTWEEADIVNLGDNYGWSIFEGDACTDFYPTCSTAGLTFPFLVYQHLMGRCAILGGYVYRGTLDTLAQGIYTFGDLCTGEIFGWNGSSFSTLITSGKSIHSFGEDESGEIYMVDGQGDLFKIVSGSTCTFSLSSSSFSLSSAATTGSVRITGSGCSWTSMSNASWITVTSGGSGTGSGTLDFSVAANTSTAPRRGTISVAGTVVSITQAGVPSQFDGYVDHAGCDTIAGWAADRDHLNTSITVTIYDGNSPIETIPANEFRPDVAAFLKDNGFHGYSVPTPPIFKDGQPHSLHVEFETTTTDLINSPAAITCSETPNFDGYVDLASCSVIAGWAADRNKPSIPIQVNILDGTTVIATVTASQWRPDVGVFLGDSGLHGYSFTVPASLMTGTTQNVHVQYAGSSTDLNNSPAMLNCPIP